MRRGFTLIELLVVITILAILAGAALPYVQSYVAESRISKAKADLDEIGRALAVYETREGEYTKGDVSDLTGRYLNKAPIDPWGMPYVVATASGLVMSYGPDRKSGGDDDITYPYQPPLALVQAKWVDRNQSGAVDTQNEGDRVQLIFSRKLGNSVASLTATATFDSWFQFSGGIASMSDKFIIASNTLLSDKKTLVLTVRTYAAFVPGSDSISIHPNHADTESGVIDLATPTPNLALSGQKVIILPQ